MITGRYNTKIYYYNIMDSADITNCALYYRGGTRLAFRHFRRLNSKLRPIPNVKVLVTRMDVVYVQKKTHTHK